MKEPPAGGSPRRYPLTLGSLKAPASVQEIVSRLERAGFETWCVGGAVRDALLGQAHLDWDLATAARPQDVMRTFKRTVPVGVEFGTVGVFDDQDVLHEVTTFRRDVRTDGRHAVVEFGVSLDDDLARRDFTINAMAFHPKSAELRDPFAGRLDLERGIVRAVGVAPERMREDRLRALRAIRFASRFSFHIEPGTWAAVVASAEFLGRLSPERVRQELEKTMQQVDRPSIALEWWRASGALGSLVPDIADAPPERFEALDQLARADAEAPAADVKRSTLQRLAMLFFGETSATATRATRALRFSNADSGWISQLAASQHELGADIDDALSRGVPGGRDLRRWVSRIGRTRTAAFFELYTALRRAQLVRGAAPEFESRLDGLETLATDVAFRDPIELADLAVDGEDLRAAGVEAGPALGRLLERLLAEVIEDPARNQHSPLLERARALARESAR